MNRIFTYNEWIISVKSEKEPDILFQFTYQDDKIIFEGVSSEARLFPGLANLAMQIQADLSTQVLCFCHILSSSSVFCKAKYTRKAWAKLLPRPPKNRRQSKHKYQSEQLRERKKAVRESARKTGRPWTALSLFERGRVRVMRIPRTPPQKNRRFCIFGALFLFHAS